MCRPTSTAPAPPTDLPRRSMDDWNTCAARPSGSATSPTTSHDRSSRPADSDPTYTLDPDEPENHLELSEKLDTAQADKQRLYLGPWQPSFQASRGVLSARLLRYSRSYLFGAQLLHPSC